MMTVRLLALLSCLGCCSGADWLQFRGNDSNSVATDHELPVSWSQTENLAWKAALPGRGLSSPIVVGDKVILTASSGVLQDRLHVLCLATTDGRQLWHRQFWATGRTITHPTSANAAPTPASDGRRVYAFFSSNDLICLDLDGNLQWLRGLAYDYPRAGNDVGMASSPAVIKQTVVLQVENQGDSFAAGIDANTGGTRWRIPREPEGSWTSPIAMRGDGAEQDVVLLQSPTVLSAHEPATGAELWRYKAGCRGIPSAVAAAGVVYVPADGMTALRPAAGRPEPSILWKSPGQQPATSSPILHRGRLYTINRAGVLLCGDASTGEVVWKLRLQGSYWGTPVLAGERLYCINQEGVGQIVQLKADGSQAEIIGKGELGETIMSSPAVAQNALFIRSEKHLFKIGTPPSKSAAKESAGSESKN